MKNSMKKTPNDNTAQKTKHCFYYSNALPTWKKIVNMGIEIVEISGHNEKIVTFSINKKIKSNTIKNLHNTAACGITSTECLL